MPCLNGLNEMRKSFAEVLSVLMIGYFAFTGQQDKLDFLDEGQGPRVKGLRQGNKKGKGMQ